METQLEKPQIGEIKHGREIGRRKGSAKFIWLACKVCGIERWVPYSPKLPYKMCRLCACKSTNQVGPNHSKWKGGEHLLGGYIVAYLPKDDFYYPMAHSNGFVLKHRLVMARSLNRCLLTWEVVHHINGVRTDNRLENLELVGCGGRHNTLIQRSLKEQAKQIKELQARVTLLEAENVLLKSGVGVNA